MTWVRDKLLGLRKVLVGGVEYAERGAINFIGPGITAADNPTAKRTDVTFSDLVDATADGIENLLVRRRGDGSADFDGTCAFKTIAANEIQWQAPVSDTRVVEETPQSRSDEWTPYTSGQWQNTTTGGALQIPLDLPHGARLDEVRVSILPAGAHAGLPGTMPQIQLVYYDTATRADAAAIGTATDTSANTTAYQAAHELVITVSHTISRTGRRYRIDLIAESGANALVGCTYQYAKTTVTRTAGSALGRD